MLQQVNSNSKHKPRVVSQANAARILDVAPSTICVLLDRGHLTPWFAPRLDGKRRRRMVTAVSIDALLRRGEV